MGCDLRHAALPIGNAAAGVAPSQFTEEQAVRAAGQRVNDRAYRVKAAAGHEETFRFLPLLFGIGKIILHGTDPLPYRRLFLQKLPESKIGGVCHKPPLHDPIHQAIVNRQQAHAQMVGHEAAHELIRLAV